MATDTMTDIIDLALVGLTVTDAASSNDLRDANRTMRSLQEAYTKDEIMEALVYALRLIVTIDATQNGIKKSDVIEVYRSQFIRVRDLWNQFGDQSAGE